MSETVEATIQRKDPAEGKRPHKIYLDTGLELTTFKNDIADKFPVGARGKVTYSSQVKGDWTNNYAEGFEPVANGNGDTPALGTGEYIKGKTAPEDKASISRAVALKAAVALATHTIPTSATPSEMVNAKVGPLTQVFEVYLSTGRWPGNLKDEDIPF